MTTTSTNFGFVISTTSDAVNVITQISNNFTAIDSALGIAHTGSGQLKNGLALTGMTLSNPVFVGVASGANIIATTGSFQTITATGGALTVNSLQVGTSPFPATAGTAGQVLTVSGTAAVWVTNTPGTGAATDLSNLATVAINTSLNNFTAGTVTLNSLTGTAGKLTAISTVQATVFACTTGVVTANLVVTGTVSAAAVNCTGGSITAAGIALGTYSFPATVGSTGQFLVATGGNAATWKTYPTVAAFRATATVGVNLNTASYVQLACLVENFDIGTNYDTGASTFTAPATGLYHFGVSAYGTHSTAIPAAFLIALCKTDTATVAGIVAVVQVGLGDAATGTAGFSGSIITTASAGEVFSFYGKRLNGTSSFLLATGGCAMTIFGYKLPDS